MFVQVVTDAAQRKMIGGWVALSCAGQRERTYDDPTSEIRCQFFGEVAG